MKHDNDDSQRLRAAAWDAYKEMVPLLERLIDLHQSIDDAHNALRGDTVPMRFPLLTAELVRQWSKQVRPR